MFVHIEACFVHLPAAIGLLSCTVLNVSLLDSVKHCYYTQA